MMTTTNHGFTRLGRTGLASLAAWLAICPPALTAEPDAQVFVQTGNAVHITQARHSPDGQWLATCDALGSVVLWDAQGGRQYREIHRHTGLCMGLAFSPDGRLVVSSGGIRDGNEVVATRWRDGQVEQVWRGHRGQVLDIAATPDARGAWSLGESDGLFRWELGAEAPLRRVAAVLPDEDPDKAPNATAMRLGRDQKRAFVARRDGALLEIDLTDDAVTRRPARLLARVPESVSAIALSPDETLLAVARGTMLASGSQDIVLFEVATGREVRRLVGHKGTVFALAFSPDGGRLGSAAQIDTQAMLAGDLKGIRQHEAVRLWRVEDGAPLAEVRNQRDLNGMPFLRGSLEFSPVAPSRLALALWDEAARIYELDGAGVLRLVHTLEGRGLSPRQLQASDASGRLLVTDGRPRVAPREAFMNAADVRREFGRDADWTPERLKRMNTIYGGRGWLSSRQRAAMWNLKSGRLERVIDWQRAPVSYLGLDGQGRFLSLAPLFPATTMVSPLRTDLVREAVADAEGQITLGHFGFDPGGGEPDDLFVALPPEPGAQDAKAAPVADKPAQADSYTAEVVTASRRWEVVAGVPLGSARIIVESSSKDSPKASSKTKAGRLFVLERLPDGRRVRRHEIALPGIAWAMTIAADDRTLWVAGTARGVPHNDDHEAWLMAVDLNDGTFTRTWQPARGVTVEQLVAHPAGNLLATNGTAALAIWDKREAERKYRVPVAGGSRNIKALAITADGRGLASVDQTGWMVFWDWPEDAPPVQKWGRQLAAPSPHLLAFANNDRRIVAGAVDGSTRLLASADGAEIARMIRFDNDEWITMIPEGYFVASQEGDRWVNVRVDGKVYGVDQFYDVFYRPDIVERKLAGLPIAPLIKLTLQDALRQPPPRVTLALPPGALPYQAGQKLALGLRAEDQGGGLGEIRLLHNGKLVEVFNRSARASEFAARHEIELVAGDNAFTLIGFNAAGSLNARPVTASLSAQGTPAEPRVFILAIGIDRYRKTDEITPLSYAVKDAGDFARAVRQSLAEVYPSTPVTLIALHDEAASRAAVDAALERLRLDLRPTDLLVWFVASHGTLDDEARYGIVLHDWDGQEKEASLFSARALLEAARTLRAFNQVVVLDTCHAGGVNSLVKGLYDARLSVLARNMGLHILASANATEEALDGYQGNGLFTHTLLEGLRDARADRNADRTISVRELGDFARRETRRIARLLRHSQEPLLMNYGRDVPVHVLR